ncbi:MAG TPA: penicillin-binding protein 2 [Phycisphaerae bacterium]|nr:penicillin-binding protein 2 [Phycisphaerae bacterium]
MPPNSDSSLQSLNRADRLATTVLSLGGLLLVLLLGRVFWLQTHVTVAAEHSLESQHDVRVDLMARRATIFMADSTPAAVSVRVYDMYADPGYIFDPEENLNALSGDQLTASRQIMADALGQLLNEDPASLLAWMQSQLYYPDKSLRRFILLKQGADEDFYNKFQAMSQHLIDESQELIHSDPNAAEEYFHALDGIGFQDSTQRVYPLGTLAGQVLGFTNAQGGLQGMEDQLNSLLVGRDGQLVYVKDASQRAIYIDQKGFQPANDGMDVWLTLDTLIQGITEQELDSTCEKYQAPEGEAIVMNPFNGDILAMANYPSLDPNNYQQTNSAYWRNRTVTDPYEPGSVFKPFNVAWGLQNQLIRLSEVFNCHEGRYIDPTGRLITDVDNNGLLSVEDILVVSSNIGMTQIGWKMGITNLDQGITTFGFGSTTGSIVPGESPGIVPPLSQWTHGTLTSASFGYGVAATPLQLVRAFCAFANGGRLVTPQIVRAVAVGGGHVESWSQIAGPQPSEQIISPDVCNQMIGAMEQVLIRGTGKNAISSAYRIFGKTGTAYLALRGQDRYSSDAYNSTFIGAGPVGNPRLVCIVVVHQPNPQLGHFGGVVAAPACVQILTRALEYLQVPPDQTPRTDPLWKQQHGSVASE